jgi:hypothetical protein
MSRDCVWNRGNRHGMVEGVQEHAAHGRDDPLAPTQNPVEPEVESDEGRGRDSRDRRCLRRADE